MRLWEMFLEPFVEAATEAQRKAERDEAWRKRQSDTEQLIAGIEAERRHHRALDAWPHSKAAWDEYGPVRDWEPPEVSRALDAEYGPRA